MFINLPPVNNHNSLPIEIKPLLPELVWTGLFPKKRICVRERTHISSVIC